MGRATVDGKSPVQAILYIYSSTLSRPGHEKSWLNPRGPPRKAKYSRETDSEPVPWGKGEKHPEQGDEKDPETVCLQTVGAHSLGDRVPFA